MHYQAKACKCHKACLYMSLMTTLKNVWNFLFSCWTATILLSFIVLSERIEKNFLKIAAEIFMMIWDCRRWNFKENISKSIIELGALTRLKSESSVDLEGKLTKPLKENSLPSWCGADALTLNYIDVHHRWLQWFSFSVLSGFLLCRTKKTQPFVIKANHLAQHKH